MLSRFLDELRAALGTKSAPRTVHRTVNGIDIALTNTRAEIADEDVFRRMGEVLAMVERYAPARMRRLRRDLAGIDVKRFACRAAFFSESRRALLELTFMVNPSFSIAEIASSLLHEGVHARVHAMDVLRTPDALAKEERLCRRTELWWGQHGAGRRSGGGARARVARAAGSGCRAEDRLGGGCAPGEPGGPGVTRGLSARLPSARQRQPKRERRAHADDAFYREISAHAECELPADGEAEADPRFVGMQLTVDLHEWLENALHLTLRYAAAGVADDDLRVSIHCSTFEHDFSARLRILDRVRQEIEKNLLQLVRICAHQPRHCWRTVAVVARHDAIREIARAKLGIDQRLCHHERLVEGHVPRGVDHTTGFQLRVIQDSVDEAEQMGLASWMRSRSRNCVGVMGPRRPSCISCA